MRRARWLVVGFVVLAALVGWVLNERGPFADHPPLPYAQFLADWGAGSVDQVVQWRDRIEVTEGGRLLLVTVPPGRDLQADLAQASPGGFSWAEIPDNWLRLYRLWVPLLILVAAILLWTSAIARNPRGSKTQIQSRREFVILVDEPAEQVPPTDISRADGHWVPG